MHNVLCINTIFCQLLAIYLTDSTLTPNFWGEVNLKWGRHVVCTVWLLLMSMLQCIMPCVSYVVDFVVALWSNHYCLRGALATRRVYNHGCCISTIHHKYHIYQELQHEVKWLRYQNFLTVPHQSSDIL